jgi:AcrR family transcriptional regulator
MNGTGTAAGDTAAAAGNTAASAGNGAPAGNGASAAPTGNGAPTGTTAAVSPAAPRLRADARRNYERLLAAAAAEFAEHGGDEVSLEQIARRAGVGIGTLYRHFPSRLALLEAVYLDQVEALRARADELAGTGDPAAALSDWLRALVAFSATKRRLTQAMLATASSGSELMSSCGAVLHGAAEQLLARAQQAGAVRPDVQAKDMIRLVHGVSMVTEAAPADPGQTGRLLGLVLDGLRPQPAGTGHAGPGS